MNIIQRMLVRTYSKHRIISYIIVTFCSKIKLSQCLEKWQNLCSHHHPVELLHTVGPSVKYIESYMVTGGRYCEQNTINLSCGFPLVARTFPSLV